MYKKQLSSILLSIQEIKLFNTQTIIDYNNPWRLNSDNLNINIGYEALIDDTEMFKQSISNLMTIGKT